jgi:4-amino-4-deoxy-L-arabinose transferase-like glycosyltransferase
MRSASNHSDQISSFFAENFANCCLLVFAITVNALSIYNDIFFGDSSLYASIAKGLADSDNFYALRTINTGDWLDKPHFPFWIWALSIKVLGANTFAFKLPALLFFLMTLRYTYLFAKSFYGVQIAFSASIILSTALHIIISNNDVRAEAILMAFIIGAVYHLHKMYTEDKWIDIVLASVYTACGVMCKGVFVVIPIAAALVGHALYTKMLWRLAKPKWLFYTLLSMLFIVPELYCLHLQFNQSTNILVNGQLQTSYLKFFFWDSQFGRFLNTGPIKGKGDVFFYLHTLLWAFAPWTLLLLFFSTRKVKALPEFYSIAATVVTVLLFSASRFQLPHYTNIIFPFLAVLVAYTLHTTSKERQQKSIIAVISGLAFLFLIALLAAYYMVKPGRSAIFIGILTITTISLIYTYRTRLVFANEILHINAIVGITLGLCLNTVFYPKILSYQSAKAIGQMLNQIDKTATMHVYSTAPHGLHYYYKGPTKQVTNMSEFTKQSNALLVTTQEVVDNLQKDKINFKVLGVFDDYQTTRLATTFLNWRTRESVLDKHFVVVINPL